MGPRHNPRTARICCALIAAVTLSALVACTDPQPTSQGARDAAPSGPEVVLRIATNDSPDSPAGQTIVAFARAVADLSAGAVRINPVWDAAGTSPDDWDQAMAGTVVAGKHQLGYIPTRAFDTLGVHTLQALQTPFLLTTTGRAQAVANSPLADDLMVGLDKIGLTGLQLFPEDLRRIFWSTSPERRGSQRWKLERSTARSPP